MQFKQYLSHYFCHQSGKLLPQTYLTSGKKVNLNHYGGTTRWFRDRNIEVVSEYLGQIGDENSPVFVLKMKSETPGFFKFEGTCEYSVKLAFCITILGDLFVKDNPEFIRPVKLHMTKAQISGIDLIIKNQNLKYIYI